MAGQFKIEDHLINYLTELRNQGRKRQFYLIDAQEYITCSKNPKEINDF